MLLVLLSAPLEPDQGSPSSPHPNETPDGGSIHPAIPGAHAGRPPRWPLTSSLHHMLSFPMKALVAPPPLALQLPL